MSGESDVANHKIAREVRGERRKSEAFNRTHAQEAHRRDREHYRREREAVGANVNF